MTCKTLQVLSLTQLRRLSLSCFNCQEAQTAFTNLCKLTVRAFGMATNLHGWYCQRFTLCCCGAFCPGIAQLLFCACLQSLRLYACNVQESPPWLPKLINLQTSRIFGSS